MITTAVGKKIEQTQGFLENGTRIPLSRIFVGENVVSQLRTVEKEGYNSVQIGFGEKKRPSKPLAGHAKKAGLKVTPRFFKEVRSDKVEDMELGSSIKVEEVFEKGDIVDVIGTSKGKGFAGVVKRYHFKGGPKTHGQSDRHRAPGSIGQSTTPGRVYKGKRMAGRMGNETVTIKNLLVMDIVDGELLVKGLVPGPKGTVVTITKRGVQKKFVPLFSDKVEEPVIDEAVVEEVGASVEEQEVAREVVEAAKDAEELAEKEAAQITLPEDEVASDAEVAVAPPAEQSSLGEPVEEAVVVAPDETQAVEEVVADEVQAVANEETPVIEEEKKEEEKV